MEECVLVALGSNLGDRDAHLAGALSALRATEGVEVVAASSVYETDPVGPPPPEPLSQCGDPVADSPLASCAAQSPA